MLGLQVYFISFNECVDAFRTTFIILSDLLINFLIQFIFQVLIIMAWHGLGSPTQLLDPLIFEDILSIFITNAVLRVIQGCHEYCIV